MPHKELLPGYLRTNCDLYGRVDCWLAGYNSAPVTVDCSLNHEEEFCHFPTVLQRGGLFDFWCGRFTAKGFPLNNLAFIKQGNPCLALLGISQPATTIF
jgi:hypothetical protein